MTADGAVIVISGTTEVHGRALGPLHITVHYSPILLHAGSATVKHTEGAAVEIRVHRMIHRLVALFTPG